jgi:hypothetical protein
MVLDMEALIRRLIRRGELVMIRVASGTIAMRMRIRAESGFRLGLRDCPE